MEQFSALRIMATDEALDVRNRDSVLMLDRCSECGREFLTRLIIPHHDSCDIPQTEGAGAQAAMVEATAFLVL